MRAYLQTQIAVVFFYQQRDEAGRATTHWLAGKLTEKTDVDANGTDEEFPGYTERILE